MLTYTPTPHTLYAYDELCPQARAHALDQWRNEPHWEGMQYEYDELNDTIKLFCDELGIRGDWIAVHGPGTERYFFDAIDADDVVDMVTSYTLTPSFGGELGAVDIEAAWRDVMTPRALATLRMLPVLHDLIWRMSEELGSYGTADAVTVFRLVTAAENKCVRIVADALNNVARAINSYADAIDDCAWSEERFVDECDCYEWLFHADGEFAGTRAYLETTGDVA